ncbi:MAG: DUF3899 domain-containing protein [Acholeplasmatales bacterium]|jgi:hypothetical protein|nr:DUF3899 domain-containing protein [Acholeplasmatales bacterium]
MKKIIFKYLLTFLVILLITVGFWGLVYSFDTRLDYISNSIFVVNGITFVVSLILFSGATRFMIGVGYAFKRFFFTKKTIEEYPYFKEYYDEKKDGYVKNTGFLLIISGFYLLVALLLAILFINNL